METKRFVSTLRLWRFCMVILLYSATCQAAVDTKSDASDEFINTLDKIFLENRERAIDVGDDVHEEVNSDNSNSGDDPISNVKTVYFRSIPAHTRAEVESDLINYFSKTTKKLQTSDLDENEEFSSLNSSQKGDILRLIPDIDILKIHATNVKGLNLNEGNVFHGDQINSDVDVVFKDQVINRKMDSEEMKSLNNDTDFKEILQDHDKTESIVIWTRIANIERMMQIATHGNSSVQWDIAQNPLFEGDIELTPTQAKDIEDGVVGQIWAGSLTADYLATRTGLNSTTLQPMVKKTIRIQNPIIDEAAKVLSEADTRSRSAFQKDNIDELLQDPDMRINILEMVKAKRMNTNIKFRLHPSVVVDLVPSSQKSSLDSQTDDNVQGENIATDEELNTMLESILEEEKKHGLSSLNMTEDAEDDDQVRSNHLNRILSEAFQEPETNTLDEYNLNQKKRNLAHHIQKRKMKDHGKWGKTVYYRFLPGFSGSQKNAVKQGLAHWQSETCLRFREGGNTIKGPHFMFAKTSDKNICGSSYVGKQSSRINLIKIGLLCFNVGVVAHEVGHALGFWHEHSRPDRDEYVTINWGNIVYGKSNFNKRSWKETFTHGIPYDYGSSMHYRSTAFGNGKTTISAKDSRLNRVMGQRDGLSFWDVKLANFHYCSDACPHLKSLEWSQCRDNGYRDPNKCKQCKCPDGFRGDHCQYYDTDTKTCGTTTSVASLTPKYITAPQSISQEQECVWIITAPPGHHLYARLENGYNLPSCGRTYLELRSGDLRINGPRYCSRGGTTPTYTALGQKLMVLLQYGVSPSYGLSFRLKYWLRSCGICDDRSSPSISCKKTQVNPCTKRYTVSCGWFGWSDCTRYRSATCSTIKKSCCRGGLSSTGSLCSVPGCGGCTDRYVKNQPACRRNITKTRLKRVKYHKSCGFLGLGRCTRYKYVPEKYVSSVVNYCCSRYRVSGSRCIK